MEDITIVSEDAQVRVTIPGKYGEIEFTIGGDDAEFVHAKGTWTYRGRQYTGKIVFARGTLQPAHGYGFTLKNDRDVTASPAAFKAISGEVSAAILAALEAHPEILAGARRAALKRRLDDAVKLTDSLTDQLAAARQAETDLRRELREP